MRNRKQGITQANTNPHGDGSYIPMLDGWRAVAIALVLLFHGFFNSDLTGFDWIRPLANLSGRTGALGVLVFFAISGYLITTRLLVEARRNGNISLRAFYIKRVFRILPPVVLYLLVLLAFFLCGLISLKSGDWAALAFLSNYIQGSWYTSHFWSLSVEEHFYLFWPLCLIVAGWHRAMWIGITLIILVGVWRPWKLAHLTSGSKARTLQHTDMRLDYIMMGCVVALLIEFYPVFLHWLRLMGSAIGLLFLFAVLLLSTHPFAADLRSLQALILTLIVCASSTTNPPWLRFLLTNPVVLFIGKISYSLYIWQQLFLGPSRYSAIASPLALPVKFAVSAAVAYLSYRFVEKPFIQYGRRLLTKNAPPGQVADEMSNMTAK